MRLNQLMAFVVAVMCCSFAFGQGAEVPLDLSGGFNADAIASPGEVQQCYLDGGQDYRDLYGILPSPHGNWILSGNNWVVTNTSGLANTYSIDSQWFHPRILTGSEGLPQDGLITGGSRDYIVASFAGNDLYPGNWTQVADPATFATKSNVIAIGALHNINDWQVADLTVELDANQKGMYSDVNFILAGFSAHKARGMQIIALYGDGTDEEVIYSFAPDTADGPIMPDDTPAAGFAMVYSMISHYGATTGSTGAVRNDNIPNMFEFASPLALNSSKTLWGFRFKDTNPTLNNAARGLSIWAATATTADAGPGVGPTADAGADQLVYDLDVDDAEEVTLDAGSSSDDQVIVKYEWSNGGSAISEGISPIVTLNVGVHTLTLTTTDNEGLTDTDTVIITVADRPATAPTADAGPDQTVMDSDGDGFADVTLDGSGSSDSNGTIVSWDWSQGMTNHGSGETLAVSLAVGVHTITLTVMDDEGLPDTDTVLVTVIDPPAENTFYVDQAIGDDGNPGTEAQPWLTISHAVTQVIYGDTIIVKEGIYREGVRPNVSGLAGFPITLKAADGEDVVLSGGLEITGWTQATQNDVNGNANYGNIYYVDVNWKPHDVYEDNQPLLKARIKGWWAPAEDGNTDGSTIVDSTHIVEPDGYWEGAEVWIWQTVGTAHHQATITDHTGHTLTISPPVGYSRYPKPEDQYYLRNKVELMDAPGQFVASDNGDGTYRVFVWTRDSAHPDTHLIEGSSNMSNFLFDWNDQEYLVLDGFEVRHNEGHGVGGYAPGANNNTAQNCTIHHNLGTGIYGRYNSFSHYYRNYVGFNDLGIQVGDATDVLIEENEVENSWYDGVITNGDNITVRRNYIHGHWWWSHADNMQTWGDHANLLIEENFLNNSGQSYMMEGIQGVTFRNNIIAGSHANMIIAGHDTVRGVYLHNNTMCFTPNQLINTSGLNFDFRDNIFMHGTGSGMFGIHFGYEIDGTFTPGTFESDYNLFYTADGFAEATVHFQNVWNRTLASYQADGAPYGLAQNSAYGNPNFANAPVSVHGVDGLRVEEFSATKIYMDPDAMQGLDVGDHIEIDWDGKVHTITAVGADYIEFTPGDDFYYMMKAGAVLNWKTNTNYTLNLTPAPGSPAIGMASDGGDVGATISTVNYMRGDFDGDGMPDITRWEADEVAGPLDGFQKAQVFYNNSVFDGNDAAANAADDGAIDTSKQVLFAGSTASYMNYTSYSKGINGLMIDLDNAGAVTAADFGFKVGNDNNPSGWASAPAPVSVTVRPGEGMNGSDRVTIIWADGAIAKQWLEVTIEANDNTGVGMAITFYIGNAVGDTGNSASDTIVDASDEIACRNNPRNFMRPAGADSPYDHNKDAKVDATDEIISRNNVTTMANDLELITP